MYPGARRGPSDSLVSVHHPGYHDRHESHHLTFPHDLVAAVAHLYIVCAPSSSLVWRSADRCRRFSPALHSFKKLYHSLRHDPHIFAMQSTSFSTNEDALDVLCHHFSLVKRLFPPNTPLQPTFEMQLTGPASRMATHVLAVRPSDGNPKSPLLMVPVDGPLYHQCFGRADFVPQSTTAPAPHLLAGAQLPSVTLPVIPVEVPHGASLPLVLLFGLGLETDLNLLASRILPPEVIGEFPNAAAMSTVMSRYKEHLFDWYLQYNQGMWKNILALGPRNTALVELVQTAYKVLADARRMRVRRW
ncbi:hypothetical protein B0H17DRAFT_1044879 [Mycena rosella]|uniref:Uncharacterized protein n=1 Tax=Mycena rosella TaxID=1033263 RepID=A0AAD7GMC5_MYCRO|nr:hypothetical protein B0H17DRAFT_1044879 [Mycena rosella]